MSLQAALNALKNQDFAAARDFISREKAASFGIQHFLIKGLAELALKDWSAALETFSNATKRFPDYALFWLNRGVAEENLELYDASIVSQEHCVRLNPVQAEACGNLSNLYRRKKHFAEAEEMARCALANGAPKSDALVCLGLALCKQGKFDEARKAFVEAHQIAPDHAGVLVNHANLEVEVFNFDAAWKLFAAARARDDSPVMRHDEGLARLLAGDYERGFALFEARLDMPRALRLIPACPRWQGESLQGKKLLILAEQGFGDVIQFCRYQKFLPEAAELVWAVPKNLVRLLSPSLRGAVLDETGPLPLCDYYVPVISLALMTRHTQPEQSPAYLTAPAAAPVLPTGTHDKKIGLVWAGSRTHDRDYERSMPLTLFAPLLNDVKADFYAPFLGDALDEIGDLPVTRLDNLITDFADTAALIRQLDCLITVDTAAAHLAGALGVRTFVLLPYCPDWRWGVTGSKASCYASLTLLRQPTYGDWHRVIEELRSLI